MTEYIKPGIEFIVGSFTPKEWRSLLMSLIFVSSITEVLKRALWLGTAAKFKKRNLYLSAFGAGVVVSFFVWPGNSLIPWFIIGVTLGPVTNFIHWATLIAIAWKFPKLADIIKGKK